MFRQALNEAAIIFAAAVVLGFAYTGVMGKGIFVESQPTSLRSATSTASGPATISLEEARRLFEAGTAIFIDARHEFDYKLGHIKGAVPLPLKEFDQKKEIVTSLPKDKLIVVYCDGAECNSSVELGAKLFLAGFSNVKIFFGGWRDWQANKLPTEKSE